jgi:UDP-glucose 4-epimerase
MRMFLVTGGAGFIGSHLCRALLQAECGVRVLDDLSSGSQANLPAEAEFIHGDIGNPGTVAQALDGVSGCFHLAAIASVERGVRDWVGTHRTNLTGTIVLLDQIRRVLSSSFSKIPFVYASSAAVYGDSGALPLTESAEKRPLSAYGADKYACELHAAVASSAYGIPTTGLRFFNVYGPRQDPRSPYSGVISIFCDRLLSGAPVEIYGDGHQTRDFIYVGDVVKALLSAMERCSLGPSVLNVCSGNPVSVMDLASTIARLAGQALQIQFNPPRSGEIRHSAGSPAFARRTLGLGDPTELGAGLEKVLAWMAEARHNR